MRTPFAAGHLKARRRRNRNARILLVEGNGPRPIPGPWVLKGIVRDADPESGKESNSPEGC